MLDLQSVDEVRNAPPAPALPSPRELARRFQLSPSGAACVARTRREIRDLLHGRDPHRLLVVVGPCSIHDPEAALEYGARLTGLADTLRDALVVVMRTYVEKPRTTLGWRGLVHDPHLDGSGDIAAGLDLARDLLVRLNDRGVACASEVLDPFVPPYLADTLAWASIGARTSESQIHRLMASALAMPVGIKNGTDGRLAPARDAVLTASSPHRFPGIDDDGRPVIVRSSGNPDAHLVLRGGERGPNHDAASVARGAEQLRSLGMARPVLIDCSHGNSGRDPVRQAAVCREVAERVGSGAGAVLGVLLESHLEAGRQEWRAGAPLRRGVSITDPCLGWSDTEALLLELAGAVRRR